MHSVLNRKKFIQALVSETVRLKLGGVDIDFEGKGKCEDDKKAFVKFIMELSIALKAKGKELTVDSFAYKWNAPNQGWWKLLLPYVDALHVMGYSETGSKSTSWRSYDFLKAAAGKYSSKLLIGVSQSYEQMGEGFSSGAPGMDREGSFRWPCNLGCPTQRFQMEN